MKITGERDYCSTINKSIMKNRELFAVLAIALILLVASCKNSAKKDGSEDKPKPVAEGQIQIGKDMITELIIKPDTTGDPWEVEKVKGYDGTQMYKILFEKIYNKELTVFDCMKGEPLTIEDVKVMEKEFNSDLTKIGKIQYIEDWYFDPATSSIIKKIKSFSFGYSYIRGDGYSVGYKPLFQVMPK